MKNRCKENPCCGDPHSCTLNTRPAAPVEGLETAETQWRCTFIPNDKWVSSKRPENMREGAIETRELVTRSQAEAIIAAERADHDNTKALLAAANADAKDYREYSERLKSRLEKMEADNVALTARVKELENSACPAPTDEDETYYTKGRDAQWFESLSNKDFVFQASSMAMDLNDTGLGDDLDKWFPFQAVIADGAHRIEALEAQLAAFRRSTTAMKAAVSRYTNGSYDLAHAAIEDLVRAALEAKP